MGWNPNEEPGEFVTEEELQVLRALWRTYAPQPLRFCANRIGQPVSLVERVEAMLFPGGMD